MRNGLIVFLAALGLFSGGLLWLGTPDAGFSARQQGDVVEQWVNPNLLRVKIDGSWHDVPLVGLTNHRCGPGVPGCSGSQL